MKIKVPDYYGKFLCKCGECRHVCCNGWRVTLSQREYFSLLGLECSPELRRKLDCAFIQIDGGDEYRFAEVKRTYQGNCIIQREDGLCSLQRECGEGVLPQICRLYPRDIVFCAMGEGACADSCEETVELLIENTEPLGFCEIESPEAQIIKTSENIKSIQDKTFEILNNRLISLDDRFIMLGTALNFKDDDIKDYSNNDVLEVLFDVMNVIEKFSPTFREYYGILKSDLGLKGDFDYFCIFGKYKNAKSAFQERFPEYDVWFEKIMANHLFYERFPYSDHGESAVDMYAENCFVYGLIKFFSYIYTEQRTKKTDFVDCICGLFRCIEHTNAQSVILNELKKKNVLFNSFIEKIIKL